MQHLKYICNILTFVMHCVPVSHRVGQRGTGLSATIARSEHEISEIIDGLSEQEVGTNWTVFEIYHSADMK